MEMLQKQLQENLGLFKNNQKEMSRCISNRQQLEAQLSENTIVLEELNLLEPEADVFKLIGPVLVKQDLTESKLNVQKRIDYISGELKRFEEQIKKLQTEQEDMKVRTENDTSSTHSEFLCIVITSIGTGCNLRIHVSFFS